MKIRLSLQYVCNSYQKKSTKKSYQKIEAVENTIKTRNFVLAKPTKNF